MTIDVNNLASTLQAKWNRCIRNAEQSIKTQTLEGLWAVAGKTIAAALASGLFAAILGAGPLGTITIMAVVGFTVFCYTSSNYGFGNQAKDRVKKVIQSPETAPNQIYGLYKSLKKSIIG